VTLELIQNTASSLPVAPTSADHLALWSAIFSGVSAVVAVIAAALSRRSYRVMEAIAKRQATFSLDTSWHDVNELDQNALIGPDVRRAVNALEMTAMVWNHDIVEKQIIRQLYWVSFQKLYDVLVHCKANVPGYDRPPSEFISPEAREAFRSMKEFASKSNPTTTTI